MTEPGRGFCIQSSSVVLITHKLQANSAWKRPQEVPGPTSYWLVTYEVRPSCSGLSLALKTSTDGVNTTSQGNPFYCWSVLMRKKFLFMSSLNCSPLNLFITLSSFHTTLQADQARCDDSPCRYRKAGYIHQSLLPQAE